MHRPLRREKASIVAAVYARLAPLNSFRKAALPALAAVGGMTVPALLFLALAPEPPASRGWGIPMAADIAFALACLRLVRNRVPDTLLTFLTALAIIDDLGAILVIAIFYATGTSFFALVLAGLTSPASLGIVVGLFLGNQLGVFGTTFLAVKAGLAPLPAGATWRHLYGMSVLAGIGFTMSLFIAALAYGEGSALHQQAKVAVLLGSLLSAATGLLIFLALPRREQI